MDPNVEKDDDNEPKFVVYENSLSFTKDYYHWIINRQRKRLNFYHE